MILFLLLFILLYSLQLTACTLYHVVNGTREPTGMWDLLKLTFAPYVIYKVLKGEEL